MTSAAASLAPEATDEPVFDVVLVVERDDAEALREIGLEAAALREPGWRDRLKPGGSALLVGPAARLAGDLRKLGLAEVYAAELPLPSRYVGEFFGDAAKRAGRILRPDEARELWRLVTDRALPTQAAPSFEGHSALAKRQRFEPFFAPFELVDRPRRPSLWGPVLPAGGMLELWGPYASLKSFLVLGALVAIAEGKDFLGWPTAQGPVLLVAAEGFDPTLDRLRAAVGVARVADRADPIHASFRLRQTMPNLVAPEGFAEFVDAVEASVPRPAVVAFDTWARLCGACGVDESSPAETGTIVAALDRLRARTGCAVVVVHHCGHAGDHGRGATSLPAAVDAELSIKRLDGGHGQPRAVVTFHKTKDSAEPEPIEVVFGSAVVAEDRSSLFLDSWRPATGKPADAGPTAHDRILLALQNAGAEGLSFSAARSATTKAGSTTSAALQRLVDAGMVVAEGEGSAKRWRLSCR